MIPTEAKCKKGVLHDFEMSRNLPDTLIEICVSCGEKAIYRKKNGIYDKNKYLRAHMRDTLQPYGRTGKLFREIYGTSGIKTATKWANKFTNKGKRADEQADLKERRIAARRLAFKGSGKSNKEIEQEIERFRYKTTGIQNAGNSDTIKYN